MRKFSLKSLLILIALLAVCLGIATNWHRRSMAQYHELTEFFSGENDMFFARSDLHQVFLEDEVEFNSKTGLWEMIGRRMDEPLGRESMWLCKHFSPLYILSAPYVWIGEPSADAELRVSHLKNVKQIVIFEPLSESVLLRWKKRFPRAKILTPHDIGYDQSDFGIIGN